jgi:Undecaprenyl-phosphate glucose phosphotransferase
MDYGQALFLFTAAVKVMDVVTVVAVWFLAWYLRFGSSWLPVPKGVPSFSDYSDVALPLALVFSSVFHLIGAYRRERLHFGFRALKKLTEGSVLGTLVFIAVCYFLEQTEFSRLYLVLFPLLCVVALALERAVLQVLRGIFERHFVRKIRVLLIGAGEMLDMYVRKIEERHPYPVEWVGRLGPRTEEPALQNIAYLGTEDRVRNVVEREKLDYIVVSFSGQESNLKINHLLGEISHEMVRIKLLPDFGRFSTFAYRAQDECGVPLLVFNETPMGATDRVVKRMLDVVGGTLAMILFAPVFLVSAILIKLTSRGPIFYSQERIGADGKIFTIYKFRTMNENAEEKTGAVWAKKGDERITRIGEFLRKTSLDEIPQFYNVIKGDMSLVGPRPERPVFVEQFRREVPKYMLRHRVKSGITGWAQINGWRGNTSIDERIKHDLFYIGHWSHRFDIKIICLTFFKGFINRHAY